MKFIDTDIEGEEQEEVVSSNETSHEDSKTDGELEFNKVNREGYEQLMKDSSTSKDGYWDSNNAFVRLLLIILGLIIVVGSLYYIMTFLGTK